MVLFWRQHGEEEGAIGESEKDLKWIYNVLHSNTMKY